MTKQKAHIFPIPHPSSFPPSSQPAMSTRATDPNKPRMLRVSDTRRALQSLLLGAEMAHKADIQTYSCGHLSPYALSQNQPHRRRTEEPIWEMSEVFPPLFSVYVQYHLAEKCIASIESITFFHGRAEFTQQFVLRLHHCLQ
jgi:hypothetical protein